jgi:hypothetical protein
VVHLVSLNYYWLNGQEECPAGCVFQGVCFVAPSAHCNTWHVPHDSAQAMHRPACPVGSADLWTWCVRTEGRLAGWLCISLFPVPFSLFPRLDLPRRYQFAMMILIPVLLSLGLVHKFRLGLVGLLIPLVMLLMMTT